MSGKLKVIIAAILTGILVSGIWAFVMYNKTKTITEKFQGEIAQLTATLDALGPNVDCYTVTEEYVNHVNKNTTGQVIEENALQVISVPESLVGETYITDPSQIVGRYFKVNVEPGTPITKDLVMAEKYDDTLRDIDIVCDSWVVGMRVGDYVDLDFTLPFGQNYVVLSHKRVQQIGTKTIKVYLTAEELDTYLGVLVDHYLNQANGTRLYLTKYVEPGIQKASNEIYAVSDAVRTMMLSDPNIVSKAETKFKASFRPALDAELNQFITEQTTLKSQSQAIQGGWGSYNGNISSDYNTDAQARSQKSTEEDTYEEQDTDIVLDENAEEETVETGAVEHETLPESEADVTEAETEAETTTADETTQSASESLPAIEDPDIVG